MVERIIAAARAVLIADGYESLSTNRVATKAGISPGSLYQYFPDKQAILDVVIGRYADELATRVEMSLGDRVGELTPQNVRAIIDALLAALEVDPVLLRVVREELPHARLQERYEALQRRMRHLTAAALMAHAGAVDRATLAARSWVAVLAIENLASRWVLDRPPIDRDRLLDEIVTLVMRYLSAGEKPGATASADEGS